MVREETVREDGFLLFLFGVLGDYSNGSDFSESSDTSE